MNITVRGETGSVTVQCSPGKESGFQYLNVSKLLMTSIELRDWKIPQPIKLMLHNTSLKHFLATVWAGLMISYI